MKYVQLNDLSELKRGDIIRHVTENKTYVIDNNLGEYAIAVTSMHVTNPGEWKVLREEDIENL